MHRTEHILITGGAGFIGSHLAERLLADGARVTALDDLSTGARANVEPLTRWNGFRLVVGSVCDETLVSLLTAECDRVVHLAAAVGVRRVVERPVETIETNVGGTEIALRAAAAFGRPLFLASTSEVYGRDGRLAYREDYGSVLGATTCARWSYAASKMIDEFLALAYAKSMGLQVVIGRLFNTVGPRQSGEWGMVVPRFVRAALRGEPLEVYGDGQQQRCFCHVADVVEAIAALMACEAAVGQVVNIGSDEAVTIEDLARRVVAMSESASGIERIGYEAAYGTDVDDVRARRPNLARIGEMIGWRARRGLDEILRDVIDYERERMR